MTTLTLWKSCTISWCQDRAHAGRASVRGLGLGRWNPATPASIHPGNFLPPNFRPRHARPRFVGTAGFCRDIANWNGQCEPTRPSSFPAASVAGPADFVRGLWNSSVTGTPNSLAIIYRRPGRRVLPAALNPLEVLEGAARDAQPATSAHDGVHLVSQSPA
jgi:hypothetical protein